MFVRRMVVLCSSPALLPGLLAICQQDDEPRLSYTGSFGVREGAASFDPSATSVVLWTRYTSADKESGSTTFRWEVAASSAFRSLIAKSTVSPTIGTNYTAALDVPSLTSNTRFATASAMSARRPNRWWAKLKRCPPLAKPEV